MSSDSPPSQASVLESAEARTFDTPDFTWDSSRLGPCCSMKDKEMLNSRVSREPIPEGGMQYKFPGTRGSLPLTDKVLAYWEVDWLLSQQGSLKRGDESLVKLGVATEDVLATAKEGTDLETQNEAGITVGIDALQNSKEHYIWARCGPRTERRKKTILILESDKRGFHAFSFLFDGPKSTVYVFRKDRKPHLLWKSPVDVKKTLYPFACLGDYDKVGKEMRVLLRCAQNIELSGEARHYLQDLTSAVEFLYSALSTPELKWDSTTIGPGCSLDDENKSVSNKPVPPNAAPVPNPFKFPGTRALINLDIENLVYWEVRWKIGEREPRTTTSQSGSHCLLQLGIAPRDGLFNIKEDAPFEVVKTADVTLLVEEDLQQKKCVVKVTSVSAQQESEDSFSCDITNCPSPLGFLFDGSRSTLWVTNAKGNKVLMRRKVKIVQTLNFFVYVGKREEVGKSIVVTLNHVYLNITEKKSFLQQLLRDSK